MSRTSLAKKLAFKSGVLFRSHCKRNERNLTVAMFHRVLAKSDPRWREADPEWTVSDQLFGECLDFFREHYSVISLDDLAAFGNGAALPARPLLITFDDGWSDNAEYALPQLRERELPAVCFVVSDAVDRRRPFWQEEVLAACRSGRLSKSECGVIWYELGGDTIDPDLWEKPSGVRQLIRKLSALDDGVRAELLRVRADQIVDETNCNMLTAEQLLELDRGGVVIGSHGKTHSPLTETANLEVEVQGSKDALEKRLAGKPVTSLSFPHGRHDSKVTRCVREAGYNLVFTSDEYLNDLSSGKLPALLGRVNIAAHEITGADGHLAPELLALWLFRREAACLPV